MRMVKNPSIGVRFEPHEAEALKAAAASTRRTLSSLIRDITVDWLERKGLLGGPKKTATRKEGKK
jgi:hypothetical protein